MNAVLVIAGPLGHPVALTLALSRGAGEGMVVVFFGLRGDGGGMVIVLGFVVMVIGFVMLMVDTNFGRGETCGAEQSGYDWYVDG